MYQNNARFPAQPFEINQVLIPPSQASYQETVLAQLPSILAYWPMNEQSGTVFNDVSGNGRHLSINGVTLDQIDGPGPSMGRKGAWDGVNDFAERLNFPTPTAEGSWSMWIRVFDASAWNDTIFKVFMECRVDNNNRFLVFKSDTANRIRFQRISGSISDLVNLDSVTSAAWIHLGLTWSTTNDRLRAFVNGAQTGATQTGLGAWAGSSATLDIGRIATGVLYFPGYIGDCICSSVEWTAAQMAIAGTAL